MVGGHKSLNPNGPSQVKSGFTKTSPNPPQYIFLVKALQASECFIDQPSYLHPRASRQTIIAGSPSGSKDKSHRPNESLVPYIKTHTC